MTLSKLAAVVLLSTLHSSCAFIAPAARTSNAVQVQNRRSVVTNAVQAPAAAATLEGEWVGWECKFSHTDGARAPIPEDYTPESMREWGVPVWGFEVLTSEQLKDNALYRKRALVFPETGCSLDDLAVEGSVKTVPLQEAGTVFSAHAAGHVLFSEAPLQGLHALEVAVLHSDEAGSSKPVRTRFNLVLDLQSKSVARAVTVLKERRYTSEVDNGALYKDGLDIRTLTELIAFPCFAEDGAVTDSSSSSSSGSGSVKGELWSVVQGGAAVDAPSATAFEGTALRADKVLNLRDGYAVQTAPAAAVQSLYGEAAAGSSSSSSDSWALQVLVPQGSGVQQVVTCVFDGSTLQSALYAKQQSA